MTTSLTETQMERVERLVKQFLKTSPYITNRILRQIAGVSYDQAIFFFNTMVREKRLKRIGVASGIKYLAR